MQKASRFKESSRCPLRFCIPVLLWLSGTGPLSASEPLPLPSPPPVTSFLALPDSNDRTPPDPHGAVGPNHLMGTLNTSVRIQTRSGDLVHTAAISAFWAGAGGPDPFDPRCTYDPYGRRWIFVACANRMSTNSALLIGVSQTADPTGAWHLRRIDGVGGGTNWIDYPTVGFNRKWIVVQALMKSISQNQFVESQMFILDKADLYAGGPAKHTWIRRTDLGPTQHPAVTLDPDLPDLYVVTTPVDEPVTSTVQLFAIRGDIGSEALVHVKTFESPEPWAPKAPGDENLAPQAGTSQGIHLQNASIQNVVYRNGSIWCVHHIFLPSVAPARSAVQWWQFTPNSLVQRGRIDDPTDSFAYPSLAVNRNNDVLIGYSQFSPDDFPSAHYAFRFGSDPPSRLRTEALLKRGEGIYIKTRGTGKNRWGDYSSTVVDPLDDLSFWTIQPYAATPEGDPHQDGSGRWGTWWGHIVAPQLTDRDGDTMPDEWELAYELNPDDPADALFDPDQDRHSNRDEYLAGTNPADAKSVLQFTATPVQRGALEFAFPTVPGRIYRIERSISLDSGNWQVIEEIAGSGEIARAIESSRPVDAALFYRLQVEPVSR